jgi:integrase
MKSRREHRVPLSKRALKILMLMQQGRNGDFIFLGERPASHLSATALQYLFRRIQSDGATIHGFRSTFRDWSAECTNFTNEVCEAALAHVIENKTEAAYRRGDLFDKRRKLMDAWAAFCETPEAGKVVAFRR